MSPFRFAATEFQANGKVGTATYQFVPKGAGWDILRNGRPFLELGDGYVPVKVRDCGICATDLARPQLPFPLPQVSGHELLGSHNGRNVVVEINDFHLARNQRGCLWCDSGFGTHCPDRHTLGIDRLPGGFGSWVLAPKNAVLPLPADVPEAVATLTEPLAAVLQALRVTPGRPNTRVAVLGPRRLGMLLLGALAIERERQGGHYEITALARRAPLVFLAGLMGADMAVNLPCINMHSTHLFFDVVYDTTGSPEGFERALSMARAAVHLKSTHGRPVCGMRCLSEMVIDELALLPFREDHLEFAWPGERRENVNVLVTPGFTQSLPAKAGRHYHHLSPQQALTALDNPEFLEGSPLPRFDLAVVGSLAEADAVIRPKAGRPSLVRPRGAVLLSSRASSPLVKAVCGRGLQIHTSRCGPFDEALALLATHQEWCNTLAEDMITHRVPADELTRGLALAASKEAVKVVLEHHD